MAYSTHISTIGGKILPTTPDMERRHRIILISKKGRKRNFAEGFAPGDCVDGAALQANAALQIYRELTRPRELLRV